MDVNRDKGGNEIYCERLKAISSSGAQNVEEQR
jgi:hypothetical protein